MRRATWLICLCSLGCADPPSPPSDGKAPPIQSSAAPSHSAPVGMPTPRPRVDLPRIEAAPLSASASPSERTAAVLDLLAGGEPATRLPVRATNADEGFDPDLRRKVLQPPKPPFVRMTPSLVGDGLPAEVVDRVVRQLLGNVRKCYGDGLRDDATMSGSIEVELGISPDGSSKGVKVTGTGLDAAVVSCVDTAFRGISFPSPEAGRTVRVKYELELTPY